MAYPATVYACGQTHHPHGFLDSSKPRGAQALRPWASRGNERVGARFPPFCARQSAVSKSVLRNPRSNDLRSGRAGLPLGPTVPGLVPGSTVSKPGARVRGASEVADRMPGLGAAPGTDHHRSAAVAKAERSRTRDPPIHGDRRKHTSGEKFCDIQPPAEGCRQRDGDHAGTKTASEAVRQARWTGGLLRLRSFEPAK